MDLGINNVSFQGNLLTRIKGNGDIVDYIKVEFAKLTKNTQGNLRMSHTWRHYNHESIDLSYGNVKMTTTGLDKFVTKDPKWLKPGELTNIANEFVGILNAFKIQNTYIVKVLKTYKKYTDVRADIKRISYEAFKAQQEGLTVLAERLNQTLEAKRALADSLMAQMNAAYEKTVAKMDDFRHNVIGDELRKNVPGPSSLHLYCKK